MLLLVFGNHQNLTLTSVVFELSAIAARPPWSWNLTLTSVVFEYPGHDMDLDPGA